MSVFKALTSTTLILALAACGKAPAQVSRGPRHGTLITYGSSITQGFEPGTYGDLISDDLNVNLAMHARGGTSLYDRNITNDFDQSEMIAMDTDWDPATQFIIWDTGINDAIIHGEDAAYQAQFRAGVTQILQRMSDAGMRAYVLTAIHNCNEARFGANAIADEYREIVIEAVAQVNSPTITLIDLSYGFVPSPGNTRDCLHPNNIGYAQIRDLIEPRIAR